MMPSLRDEFEAARRFPWRKLLKIAGAVLALWLVVTWWPPSTLRHALRSVDETRLAQPYRNRPFKDAPFVSWNWADASRRQDIIAAVPNGESLADEILRVANGTPFLVHPTARQALVATPRGAMFVMKLGWERYNGIAREARGGPVLDIARYVTKPDILVIPVDVVVDYVRQHEDGFWRFFVTHEGQDAGSARNAWTIYDAVTAVTLIRKAAS